MGRFCGFNVKLGTGICGSGYNFSKFTRILYIDSCKSSKSHKICDARLCHHFSEFFVCLYICLYMDPPKLEYDNPITWGIFKFQFWVKMWILTKIIPEYDQLPLCWRQTFSLCHVFAVHIAS